MSRNPKCLFLIGPPGSGKSIIAKDMIPKYNMYPLNNKINSGTLDLLQDDRKHMERFIYHINGKDVSIRNPEHLTDLIDDFIINKTDKTAEEYINNLLDCYFNENYTYNFSIDNLVLSTNFNQILYKKIFNEDENINLIKDILLIQSLKTIKEIFKNIDDYYNDDPNDDCNRYKTISSLDLNIPRYDQCTNFLEELKSPDDIIKILSDNIEIISKLSTNFNNVYSSFNDCKKPYTTNIIYDILKIINSNSKVTEYIEKPLYKPIQKLSENISNLYYKIRTHPIFIFKNEIRKSIDNLNDLILDYLIKNKKDFIFETTLLSMNSWYYETIIKLYVSNYKINAIFPYVEDDVHKNRMINRLYSAVVTLKEYNSDAKLIKDIINSQIALSYSDFTFNLNNFNNFVNAFTELSYLINSIIGYDVRSFKKNIKYLNIYNYKYNLIYDKQNNMDCNNGMCLVINMKSTQHTMKSEQDKKVLENNLENRYTQIIKEINDDLYKLSYINFKYINELVKNGHNFTINIDSIYIFNKDIKKLKKNIYTQLINTFYENKDKDIKIDLIPNLFNLIETNNRNFIVKYKESYIKIMKIFFIDALRDDLLFNMEKYMGNDSYSYVSAIYQQSFLANFTKNDSSNINSLNNIFSNCTDRTAYDNFIYIICNEILSDILIEHIKNDFVINNRKLKFMAIRIQDNKYDFRYKDGLFNYKYKYDDKGRMKINDTFLPDDNTLFSASGKLTTKNVLNYCCNDWNEYVNDTHYDHYKRYNRIENGSIINTEVDEIYKVPYKKIASEVTDGDKVSLDILCVDAGVNMIFDKYLLNSFDDDERNSQTHQLLIKSHISQKLVSDSNDKDFTCKINVRSKQSNNVDFTLNKSINSIISLFDVKELQNSNKLKMSKLVDTILRIYSIKDDSKWCQEILQIRDGLRKDIHKNIPKGSNSILESRSMLFKFLKGIILKHLEINIGKDKINLVNNHELQSIIHDYITINLNDDESRQFSLDKDVFDKQSNFVKQKYNKYKQKYLKLKSQIKKLKII